MGKWGIHRDLNIDVKRKGREKREYVYSWKRELLAISWQDRPWMIAGNRSGRKERGERGVA